MTMNTPHSTLISELTPPEGWSLKEFQDNQIRQLVSLFAIPLVVLDSDEWLRGAITEAEKIIKLENEENL